MTHAEPRLATAADAAGIAECVRAAYTHYIERIGTRHRARCSTTTPRSSAITAHTLSTTT